jgi:hypothetical protein
MIDSYWDLYVAYIAKCVKENKEQDIDPHHYEMEWNHWLPKACFPDLPLGQYLTLKQHSIASSLQTLALKKNCMCGWHKKHLPSQLWDLSGPLYGLDSSKRNKGENNPCYGRVGELNPNFGRTGELHPMFGKKRPEHSTRMSGEGNPNFGRTGEKSHLFGRVRSEESRRRQGQTNLGRNSPEHSLRMLGEGNPNFGKKWWCHPTEKSVMQQEKPGPDWQNGQKWKPQQ